MIPLEDFTDEDADGDDDDEDEDEDEDKIHLSDSMSAGLMFFLRSLHSLTFPA